MRTADKLLMAVIAVLAVALAVAWIRVVYDTLHIEPAAYVLASLVFSFDLIDMFLRMYLLRAARPAGADAATQSKAQRSRGIGPAGARLPLRPYAFVLSVHNLEREIDLFTAAMARHRERMWVVDDCSTDNTALRLRAAGVRCLSLTENVKKPAAIRQLLARLPPEIITVIVLDPDSLIPINSQDEWLEFEECIREFQEDGAAALCPRVTVTGEGTLKALQRLEYDFSFRLGRRSLGDFATTGGLAVYRRDALATVLARHSLSVYAEDLENALLLLGRGERIYYDDRIVVATDGARTLGGWFSQRVGWWFGLLRVYVRRRSDVWATARRDPVAFYQYVLYSGGFALAATPLKVASCVILAASLGNGIGHLVGLPLVPDTPMTHPLLFTLVYLKSMALVAFGVVIAVPRGERAKFIAVIPLYMFYVLGQIVPMTLGYLNWLSLALVGRRFYDDHYDTEVRSEPFWRAA